MDFFSPILGTASALLGAAMANWGSLRQERLRSRAAALQAKRERRWMLEDKRQVHVEHQREVFLTQVLLARERIETLMPNMAAPGSVVQLVAETPCVAARQAYAVALLYLGELRPLAKSFYLSTARLQLMLDGGKEIDASELMEIVSAWQSHIIEIEEFLFQSAGRDGCQITC